MKLALSHVIAVNRDRVFRALVDPAMLQRLIPGCESLVAAGPDAYDATLKIGIGGLKGTYTGRAAIANREPPESLMLTFDGKGGSGFLRGSAAIALSADGDTTRVSSDADVQVGGLIAAVGSRLIEAAARKLAGEFFGNLERILKSDGLVDRR